MNLAPLLAAPLPVIVHVATVVPAFGIGLWQFVGALVIAGAFAFTPGRIMYQLVFG